jgi:hypothetical protein
VTHATGPFRVRQTAWYFRRERGINCPNAVRARLGKVPTDGWRVPSGLRRPNPTTPGTPARSASKTVTRSTTRASKPSPATTSGFSSSSQRPRAARQPALTPTANPPFSPRRISRTPGLDIRRDAGTGPSDALSTTTTSQTPPATSGDPARVSTRAATSGQAL